MRTAQLDALVEAAEEGIDRDGLSVSIEEGGYRFRTPDTDRPGVSEQELRSLAGERAAYVTNWYYWDRVIDATDPSREAFLQWAERADELSVSERYEKLREGINRSWGQLRLTVTRDDHGLRQYEVRHADDADADRSGLDAYEDPLEARELVKTDPKGRYRPLKTAPTLPRGWTFVDLDGPDLVRTVDYVYPATIANWYRERTGDLDVTHWRACAQRQTGMYDLIEELDRDAVGWLAEACCDDSQCLRRREWEYDDGEPLGVDGGDGEFPCREPCSLAIAGARKWTIVESERPRTYEFELTPSEKNQLEAIIEAVADGRIDDIREADLGEGANRYRVRFLRAKHFDDEGNLGGVSTTSE